MTNKRIENINKKSGGQTRWDQPGPVTWDWTLDDDLSIHGIWKDRFSSKNLYEVGIEHFTFTSGEDFKEWFVNNKSENSKRLYLVDYELLNQKQTGLEIIEEMGIGPLSILVSSRYEENKIREKCEQLGVQLLPKAMAFFSG